MTGRGARLDVCQECLGLLLVGLDADRAACHVRADYARLTTLGELLALAAGRATFALTAYAGRVELDHRDRWQIGGRSPADHVVLAEHACGAPPLPGDAYDPRRPLEPPRRTADDDVPPF